MFWKLSGQEERLRQWNSLGSRRESEVMDWWCRCGACQPMVTEKECFCCTEWELVLPSMGRLDIFGEEDSTQRDCVTTNDAFTAFTAPSN